MAYYHSNEGCWRVWETLHDGEKEREARKQHPTLQHAQQANTEFNTGQLEASPRNNTCLKLCTSCYFEGWLAGASRYQAAGAGTRG